MIEDNKNSVVPVNNIFDGIKYVDVTIAINKSISIQILDRTKHPVINLIK